MEFASGVGPTCFLLLFGCKKLSIFFVEISQFSSDFQGPKHDEIMYVTIMIAWVKISLLYYFQNYYI